ncbi:putative glycoside hydrolase [Patescibacteria group bacterium]
MLTAGFVVPEKTVAQHDDYPKLANYFLKWDVNDADINELARWDIVILSPQALERNPQVINKLRQKNPRIKILVYVLLQEINVNPKVAEASKYYKEITKIVNQNNWWLRTSNGQHVNWWPETQMINASISAPKNANGKNWSDFLPNWTTQTFLSNNTWDGVFYDNAWKEISWLNQPIDSNKDGAADSKVYMDEKWRTGINQIINKTRQLAPDKLIVANANSNVYNSNLNGRMQENFPASNEGGWTGSMTNYLNHDLGHAPKYFIINRNTLNTGGQDNYNSFRFGLTSTLLGEGYYSYDFGDTAHESTWWYDEYNFFLGRSVSGVKNLLDENSTEIKPGVWKREFQNGIVLVNSTGEKQKVQFREEYEKIKGDQDPRTNSGAVIKTASLNAYDGIILLRRIEEVTASPYFNGTFVRAFNKYGDSVRNGFFIYDKQYKGGDMLVKKDLTGDGQNEIIVADKSKITIYNQNKQVINSFYPYGPNYNLGINFAINDYENDGRPEIVTGTMRGYQPLVKVFDAQGNVLNDGFHAYQPGYMGGVNVAYCDTNGNGKKEIVVGAGHMGGPQVRIFGTDGKLLSGGFFAYHPTFRGGVNVACGDIDGNGIDEIVTGAGYGGSSHVRYFNSKFEPLSPGFWAFGKESRTGVRIVINDLDNDGKAEILAAAPETFTTVINRYNW